MLSGQLPVLLLLVWRTAGVPIRARGQDFANALAAATHAAGLRNSAQLTSLWVARRSDGGVVGSAALSSYDVASFSSSSTTTLAFCAAAKAVESCSRCSCVVRSVRARRGGGGGVEFQYEVAPWRQRRGAAATAAPAPVSRLRRVAEEAAFPRPRARDLRTSLAASPRIVVEIVVRSSARAAAHILDAALVRSGFVSYLGVEEQAVRLVRSEAVGARGLRVSLTLSLPRSAEGKTIVRTALREAQRSSLPLVAHLRKMGLGSAQHVTLVLGAPTAAERDGARAGGRVQSTGSDGVVRAAATEQPSFAALMLAARGRRRGVRSAAAVAAEQAEGAAQARAEAAAAGRTRTLRQRDTARHLRCVAEVAPLAAAGRSRLSGKAYAWCVALFASQKRIVAVDDTLLDEICLAMQGAFHVATQRGEGAAQVAAASCDELQRRVDRVFSSLLESARESSSSNDGEELNGAVAVGTSKTMPKPKPKPKPRATHYLRTPLVAGCTTTLGATEACHTGCCAPHSSPRCFDDDVARCVCARNPFCCEPRGQWDWECVQAVEQRGCARCPAGVE